MADSGNIIIRNARPDEIDSVLTFIRDHYYQKNHVYTRRRDLFLEHHFVNGRLCFILAIDADSDEIVGLAGYFPSQLGENPDLFVSMLQTITKGNSLIGLQMVQAAQSETGARCLISSGVVRKVLPIYRYMGYETGQLTHYYRYFKKDGYSIAVINEEREQAYIEGTGELVRFPTIEEAESTFDFTRFREHIPYKDRAFVNGKYFDNIGYDYHVFGIMVDGACDALLIGRDAEHAGAKAFKIIDYIGDAQAIRCCGPAIDSCFGEAGYEFIDFYGYGFDDSAFTDAGFNVLDDSDPNIIPHYFEPFEPENIDINFFTSIKEICTVTRADGGQDRPNFLDDESE